MLRQAGGMSGINEKSQDSIYEAAESDADAIADIHAASWREVYRGILPDTYLDHEVCEERRRFWAAALHAPREGAFVLAAADTDGILGFISVATEGEPGYDAVIESLHIAADRRGNGIGRRLIHAATTRLQSSGANSVCLRAYDANEPAIHFYERLGGRKDGKSVDPFAGASMPDTRFGWRDLAALREACQDNNPMPP